MNKSNIKYSLAESNPYCKYDEPDLDITRTVKVMALLVVGGFGVFGNVFVIVLAVKYTERKNLHHLIINTSVSDTLVVFMTWVFDIPPLLDYNTTAKLDSFRRTLSFLYETSTLVSLVTLFIISIERFRITRHTRVQISQPYTLKQRVAVLACSWVVAMALNSVYFYDSSLKYDHFKSVSLYPSRCVAITCYCASFILSILTLRRLSKPQDIQNNLSEVQRELRRKRMVGAVRMVLCSLLLYSCCYLPSIIHSSYVLFFDFKGLCIDKELLLFFIFSIFPLVNSCLSPCVYIIFLTDFRNTAKRLLFENNISRRPVNRHNSVDPNREHSIQTRNDPEIRELPVELDDRNSAQD